MKILVLNAGSSSVKYQLFNMDDNTVIAKGGCERIGFDGSFLTHKPTGKDSVTITKPMPDHKVAIKMVMDALTDKNHGVIASMKEVNAVGHRVLHSGGDFDGSVLVGDNELKIMKKNIELGPLHMPANIMGIEACMEVMPNVPQVAVFDTAFHATMPPKAYMYAIPYSDYKKYKVRKYGFHGTSHKFVSGEAAKFLNNNNLKTVTAHLGNGASMAAVVNGKCVDTSMGLTPLEGLVMGTRSGDIDPACCEFLMNKTGMNISEMLTYLNKKSGLLGVSEFSNDFRDVLNAANQGNEKAKLAIDMFAYRVKKYIGSYAAAMGGIDCLVFTGGIAEHNSFIREQITEGLEFLGIEIDHVLCEKATGSQISEISKAGSKCKVLVIPTNEELVIARETLDLI